MYRKTEAPKIKRIFFETATPGVHVHARYASGLLELCVKKQSATVCLNKEDATAIRDMLNELIEKLEKNSQAASLDSSLAAGTNNLGISQLSN